MKMKYYDGHDVVYQRLKAEGQVTWDRRAYDDFYLKPFLQRVLKDVHVQSQRPRALEVGCGTGPAAAFLAQNGFDVTAIDVSATALEIGRSEAQRLGLQIHFLVHDWLTYANDKKFDLILDGHCLHCIVFDEDRRRALEVTRSLLREGGNFVLETMVHRSNMDFGSDFKTDDTGILWVKVKSDNALGPVQKWDGWFVPSRRLLRVEQIERELNDAGFRIVDGRVVTDPDLKSSDQYQAICSA